MYHVVLVLNGAFRNRLLQGSTAPTLATSGQKAAHFCSSQRKPKQRRARRRVAGLLAVTAAAAAAHQVLTESVLSDCPSDPLLHNVRDRKTRMQLLQKPQQVRHTSLVAGTWYVGPAVVLQA